MQPHTAVLVSIIKGCKYKSYLELGIDDCSNIGHIIPLCQRVVGVDIKKPEHTDGFTFFHGTTDEFFRQNKDLFDVVFIDANHESGQVIIDFCNASQYINTGGLIVCMTPILYRKSIYDPMLVMMLLKLWIGFQI